MQYTRLIPLALALTLRTGVLFSEPEGFHLRAGEALAPVRTCEGALFIESGKNASIDWDSFSIGPGEIVRFQQQDAMSAVLNRVMGPLPSSLFGTLESNGAVYLVNPNGILIGSEAHILTAGFIASTLDLSGEHFAEKAFVGESNASVVNYGKIVSSAGDVFLIAKRVENHGEIAAQEGRVGLLSGWDILIRGEKAPEVRIQSEALLSQEAIEENPYALAICQSGKIKAKGVYLEAGAGKTEMSGDIEAPGGIVHVLGDVVHLLDEAKIDVSCDTGGGTVLVGGDYQGKNPEIKNAQFTWAGTKTSIEANALQEGNGGKVVLWSDGTMFYYGKVRASGGALKGDGGFVEISGKEELNYSGFVDTPAPFGKHGTLLLDPTNITIQTAGTTTGTWSGCGAPPNAYQPSGTGNIITVADLESQLGGGGSCDVLISTASASGDVGTITISNSVTWSTTNKLTLTAVRDIVISASITNTYNPGSPMHFIAMDFTAQGAVSASAYQGINVNATVSSFYGDIIMSGTSGSTNTSSAFPGNAGILINNSGLIRSLGSGANAATISLTGISGNPIAGGNNEGIAFNATGALNTIDGDVTFTGTGRGTGTSTASIGVDFNAAVIQSTGTGNITVTGTASTGSGGTNQGVRGNNPQVSCTSSGNLTFLNCTGGNSSGANNAGVYFNTGYTFSTNTGSITFSNCTGGNSNGGSSEGVRFAGSGSVTSSNSIIFENCTGGISTTTGNSGVIVAGTITVSAPTITATGILSGTGAGTNAMGFRVTGVSIVGSTSTARTINITATSQSSGTNGCGIQVDAGGQIASGSTGTVTLNGTGANGSTGCHGINVSGTGVISTGSGALSLTGSASGSGANVGVNIISSTNSPKSTSGPITISGSSTGATAASHGVTVSTNTWTPGTTALVTFSNCTGGNTGASHGVNFSTAFTAAGAVTFSTCTGGTGGGYGINSAAVFSAAGNVTATTAITGQGANAYGFSSTANFSSSGGSISITANSTGTSGTRGISITAGTLSTSGSNGITLDGTSSASGSAGSTGVLVAGSGIVSSAAGQISITGLVPVGATGVAQGVQIATAGGLVSSSGDIILSGITNSSSGTTLHGLHLSGTLNVGTTGTVTFQNCRGSILGTAFNSNGVEVGSTFSSAGDIIAITGIVGGNAPSAGFHTNSSFSTSGNISITASNASATNSVNWGILVDQAPGRIQTTGANTTITLIGSCASTNTSGNSGFQVDSTARIVAVGGTISIAGSAPSGGSTATGFRISSAAANQISTTGAINISGTSAAAGANSHGVSNTQTWATASSGTITFGAPITDGVVTISGCTGGAGATSHGINSTGAFTHGGPIVATNSITAGSGSGSVGFLSSNTFTTSGISSPIAITATANGTAGACHGISLTGGSLSTTGGGSITLIGAGGASTTAASHGINLTGGAATVSTATGNGAISLTGTASGDQASFGVNIAGSAAGVINSTSGTIAVSGTSSSTGAGSHGVSVAAAWTPATSQTVTFSNCQGGGTGASHGVNLGAAFTGAGAVTFSTCTGGAGGGNGINNAAAFSTTGAVTATALITGNGSGGVGFASSQNFTSTAGTIAITATANGTAGACHGISLTGGSLSTTGGGSLTLNGTGGASTTAASHGINIEGGAATVSTATGNGAISLTGIASGSQTSFGVNIAGTVVGVVNSSSGTITVDGSSSATGADSYGVLVGGTSGWTPGTSSLVSITGTGTGLVAQGVNVSQPLINTGAISITGTSAAGFGNSFEANVSTSGGAITVTGSSILAATPIVFNTTVSGSANITFSGSTSTIDATSSGSQALTLTAGATGTVTLGGNVGATTPLGAVTISSGALGLSISLGVTTIDAASFTVAGTVPTTLNGLALLTIDTSAFVGGNIAFGGTITGSGLPGTSPLTLVTDGAGTITLSGNVGATRLGAFIIGAGSGGLSIGTGVTSIAANSFTVAGTVTTTLNNTGTVLIDTSGSLGGSIAFGGEIAGGVAGSNPLTLTANGLGTVTLSSDVGAMTRLGAFTIGAGGGGLVVETGVTTIAANSFTVAGVVPTTLNNTSALTIDTSGLPGAIAFGGSVTGTSGQNLDLDPGTSNITLSSTVSLGAGGLTFANATNSTASGTITAAFLTQPAGLGTSSFQGITLSGDMSVTTSGITLNGAISAGNVTLANAGVLAIGSAADMTLTGNFDQTGIGAVTTAGDITTDGGDITFISAADLTGTISLTTGGATGTVTLGTVNATALLGSHGLTVLGHDVVFNGPVGIGTPLLNLSATGATIELHGNQAVSAGPMTYMGVVHLEANIFLSNSGAGTVSFLQLAPDPSMVGVTFDSVLGNFDLTITADSAEVLFEGDVNLAGVDSGSPTAGGDLEVAGGLGITLEGQVLVQGGSHTGVGAGMNGGTVSLTSSNGTISLHNINVSGGDGSSAGGGGGNITIQPSSALSGGYPVGLIVINADLAAAGNLVSMGGTGTLSGLGGVITLSANRSAQPTVATIASSAAGNDITTESLILTIGAHEAITAIGDLSLNATVITIGDAVALGNLEIVSSLANLHTHGDVDLLDYLGNLYISPTAHFFAGGTYSQSGTLTPSGPLDAGGGVALTADLLLFDGHVLNFDTTQIPIPGPEINLAGRINPIYRLGIAGAEFFDDLPILRDFPAKPFWIRRVATLRGEPQSIEKLQRKNKELERENEELQRKLKRLEGLSSLLFLRASASKCNL